MRSRPALHRPALRRPASLRPVAGAVLALAVVYAIVWPTLAPAGWSDSDYRLAALPPSWPHLLGADALGHDLSVRIAQALQVSLAVAAGSALAATAIGVLVGAAAAAGGARLDGLLMRLTDAVAAVPHLLATVAVVALFRGSVPALVLALALTHWPQVARIVRAETQKVMSSAYVAASRAAGASPARLVRHHVLPAVAGQAGVAVVMMVPHAVWHESTLSFLGVGLPPERASLGTLIAMSRGDLLLGRWWALAFPAAALVVVTVAVALLAPSDRRRRPIRAALRHRTGHDDDYDDVTVAVAAAPPAAPPAAAAPARGHHAGEHQVASGYGTGQRVALRVESLTVSLPDPSGDALTVLDGVSLEVGSGRVVAVVGESGAGKSTFADACCGLLPRDARVDGRILIDGVARASRGVARGRVGHVPQSTAAAFTPTRHLRGQLEEILAAARRQAGPGGAGMSGVGMSGVDGADGVSVAGLCAEVGLDPALVDRYPHQLSGGQLRRAAIAAALAASPTVVIADEPTAGLDPQPALAALRLLRRLADDRGLAVVVITHDLAALAESGAADHLAVFRDGTLCDHGPAALLLTAPAHPYTRELVTAAAPVCDAPVIAVADPADHLTVGDPVAAADPVAVR